MAALVYFLACAGLAALLVLARGAPPALRAFTWLAALVGCFMMGWWLA